ncbi:MAG: hypothetical protein Q8O57_11835 [Kiritimatiellota bacterium]|nr:hypothetical protein [Kiritimatiellota bacterium]
MIITIQYLEDAPELAQLNERAVVEKLQAARGILPITHLLIGWHLRPPRLLEACRKEAERGGMRFIRWHPLLTGDGIFQPRLPWQVINLQDQPVSGYRNLPEFTFVCPNHPAVQQGIQQRLAALLQEGIYQGFFLDRIRFPSPASGPLKNLGCFCPYCRQKAAAFDLDLAQLQHSLLHMTAQPGGRQILVEALLAVQSAPAIDPLQQELCRFLDFRMHSVTAFVAALSQQLRQAGIEIGLDCFSPGLTQMVGQDLHALGALAGWIKVMSYAHTLGPAGLPFELLGLYDELTRGAGLSEAEALDRLSRAASLPLPTTRRGLERQGLSPQALESELRRGVAASSAPVLAGVELVEIAGVARLSPRQITRDLAAIRRANPAGLAISWDLRHIPLERLELVRREYF